MPGLPQDLYTHAMQGAPILANNPQQHHGATYEPAPHGPSHGLLLTEEDVDHLITSVADAITLAGSTKVERIKAAFAIVKGEL